MDGATTDTGGLGLPAIASSVVRSPENRDTNEDVDSAKDVNELANVALAFDDEAVTPFKLLSNDNGDSLIVVVVSEPVVVFLVVDFTGNEVSTKVCGAL
jgi:hypothetical protein